METISRLIREDSIGKGFSDLKKDIASVLPNKDEVDDYVMLKAFGTFLCDVSGMPVPELFECGLLVSEPDYVPVRDSVLNAFPDAFRFIRLGLPLLVKDFGLFRLMISKSGFHSDYIDKATIAVVLLAMKYRESEFPDPRLFQSEVTDVLNSCGWFNSMSIEHFRKIVISMSSFVLSDEDAEVKVSSVSWSGRNAIDAVELMKTRLMVTGIEEQLELCALYYTSPKLNDEELWEAFLAGGFSTIFSKDNSSYGDIEGNEGKRYKKKEACKELRSMMKEYTSPIDLLCSFHQRKNLVFKAGGEEVQPKSQSFRSTDDRLECGLVYDLFTSTLNEEDKVLIVFPSPFFIRSFYEDEHMRDIDACFVVKSDAERKLLRYMFSGEIKRYEKRDKLSVKTITELNKEISGAAGFTYGSVLVFSLSAEREERQTDNEEWVGSVIPSTLELMKDRMVNTDGRIRLFCLGADYSFAHRGFFAREIAESKRFCVESILMMPTEIESGTRMKKKSLWVADNYCGNTDVVLSFPGFVRDEKTPGGRIVLNYGALGTVSFQLSGYFDSGIKTLRTYASKLSKGVTTEKEEPKGSYESAVDVKFTEDIVFHYTKSWREELDAFRVYAYINGVDGRKVQDSIRQKDFSAEDQIESWVRDEYPFLMKYSRKKDNPGKKSLREIICREYSRILREMGQPIHFNSLMFVFKNNLVSIVGEDSFNLVELLKQNDVVWKEKTLEEISSEEYSGAILSLGLSKKNQLLCLQALSKILDFAVGNGFCTKNEFIDLVYGFKREGRMFSIMKSVFARKTMSEQQDKSFYSHVMRKIEGGNSIYAGVLIEFLTGLEPNAVLALTWDDFHEVGEFGFHQLQVYNQVYVSDGEVRTRPFSNITDFRCIPCSELLEKALNRLKSKVEKARGFRNDRFIVSDPETGGRTALRPERLRKAVSESFTAIGMKKENMDELDDLKDETTDFGRWYAGNILRENWRFMASKFAKFNIDEIAYVLGNVPSTTAGRYYIDFQNDASQLALYAKMCRLDRYVVSRKEFLEPGDVQEIMSKKVIKPRALSSSPTFMNIIADSDPAKDYKIHAKSRFGLDIQISE